MQIGILPRWQMLKVGAIQKGDPGYEEFLDDLDYARSVLKYGGKLHSGGVAVHMGTKSPGEVKSFEDIREKYRQGRK